MASLVLAAVLLTVSKTASSKNSCKLVPEHPVPLEFQGTQSFHTHGKLAVSETMEYTQFETVSDLIENSVFKYTHKLSVYFTKFQLTPHTKQHETTVTEHH